jgi:hypothetical protein
MRFQGTMIMIEAAIFFSLGVSIMCCSLGIRKGGNDRQFSTLFGTSHHDCSTDSSNGWALPCVHKAFFVWEQDDSIMSWWWCHLSWTHQILWRNFKKTWRNFKGTLKETSKYTSKFFRVIFYLFPFFGLSLLNIAYRRSSWIFEYLNLFKLFEVSCSYDIKFHQIMINKMTWC